MLHPYSHYCRKDFESVVFCGRRVPPQENPEKEDVLLSIWTATTNIIPLDAVKEGMET